MKTLANILTHESLPKRYNREYSDNPTISAQKNLEGRTHFVDPQTLKFHGSRVLSALPVSDGAFFKIIETTSLDYQHTKRGYRAVVFDLFGTTIYHPDLENTHTSKEKADKAFYAWFDTFDEIGHYQKAIAEKITRLNKEAQNLTEILKELGQKVEIYAVVGYSEEGIGTEISRHETKEKAEIALIACQEGDDKNDPWSYFVEEVTA